MKKHNAYDQEEFKEGSNSFKKIYLSLFFIWHYCFFLDVISLFASDYLRILPPGTETNTNLYGELLVSIGELAWLKTAFPPENTKIRVKFWG